MIYSYVGIIQVTNASCHLTKSWFDSLQKASTPERIKMVNISLQLRNDATTQVYENVQITLDRVPCVGEYIDLALSTFNALYCVDKVMFHPNGDYPNEVFALKTRENIS